MKKFSMNLLKVSLLFILGLCMCGIENEVKANNTVYMTYYAEAGDTITTQFDWSVAIPFLVSQKLYINNGNGFVESGYSCEEWTKDITDNIITFKLPDNLPPEQSYFVYRDVDDYNEIYILGKHTLTNSKGETKINLTKGNSTDLYMKYVYRNGVSTEIKLAKTLNKIDDYSTATDRTPYYKESKVSFKSEDNNVATVDKNGRITAVGVGETTITMTRVINQTRLGRTAKSEFTATIDVAVAEGEIDTSGENITITVNANGGKIGGEEILELPWPKDDPIELSDTGMVRNGYKLIGFGTDSQNVKYSLGVEYDIDNDITLYAIWEETGGGYEVKLTYSNGNELAKDDCLQYKNGTQDSGNNTWNLRKDGSVIGEIGPGDIVQITGLPSTGDRVSVKVVKVENGSVNGNNPVELNQEGYIAFNDNAKAGFYKVEYTTADITDTFISSADTSFMGVILNLISSIMSFIVNNVLPLLKPMITTTFETVGPLVTDIFTGIMN